MEERKRMGRYNKDVIIPVAADVAEFGSVYKEFVEGIKVKIQSQRTKMVLQANSSLILLYWNIGNAIAQKQSEEGWDANIVLIDKVDTQQERIWYAQKALEEGWRRRR